MNKVASRLGSVAFCGVVAAMALGQTHAQAGDLSFSISGPDVSAKGTLSGNFVTLSGFADSVFVVTGANGSYSDTQDGLAGTITGVLPSKTYTSIPSNGNHDSVNATGVPFPPASYDNILYPHNNSPVVCDPMFYPYHGGMLDIYGLMFTLNLQGGGNGLVNLWSNGNLNDPSNPIGLDYGVSDGTLTTVNGNPFFTVENYLGNTNSYPTYTASGIGFTAVPEPSALIALGSGLAAWPLLRLRRKKRA